MRSLMFQTVAVLLAGGALGFGAASREDVQEDAIRKMSA